MKLTGKVPVVAEAVAVALVVGAVHVAFRIGELVGAYEDDGVYVVLAKAIALGDGYRSIHLVGAPVQVRYPPGLPLLLSLPWALGGSLSTVRMTVAVANVIATAGAAGLLWWVGRRQLGLAPVTVAVCAISPLLLDATIELFNIPLTEPYFVLGWAVALAVSLSMLTEPRASPREQRSRAAALGLVLAATTLFRTVAISIVPAVLLALWVHRRRIEAAVCFAAALLPLALWAVLKATWIARGPQSPFPDDLGYWRWLGVGQPVAALGAIGGTAIANALVYWRHVANLMLPIRPAAMSVVAGATLLAAVACVLQFHRLAPLILMVVSATALTLLWPFVQDRLLLPLLPFAGLLVASAVEDAARRVPLATAGTIRGVLLLIALGVGWRQLQLRAAAGAAFRTGALPPQDDRSPLITLLFRSRLIAQVSDWVHDHTTLQDRVMVQVPSGVYLYTGRQVVTADPTESPFATSVFAVRGRYLGERILADSVSVIVWTPAAVALGQDIAAIRSRCPHVLAQADTATRPPLYFRVTRDDTCLQGFLRAPSPPRHPDAARAPR